MAGFKTDLILLHAPSVYDFRKKSIMFGPVSDLVPSSPIFEMYPIGFMTIANYLSKRGISVRIINIAYRMFHEPEFDVELFIKKLNAVAFGIDLHWLPHCQGSTELAKIVKKYHPCSPVIFGGFSSSYFYRELIDFYQVDYILRGDSTEEPLFQLIKCLKSTDCGRDNFKSATVTTEATEANAANAATVTTLANAANAAAATLESAETAGPVVVPADSRESFYNRLRSIPNLVYKKNGQVFTNPINCISTNLEEIDFDYRIMFKQVIKYRDVRSIVPFCDWFRYPITTIPVVRGCNNNCSNCGGSKYAFELFGRRAIPAFRDPEKLVNEIKTIRRYMNSPVFMLGDLNSNGRDYIMEFFRLAKGLDKELQIFFEFFSPPKRWFFKEAEKTFSKVCYEISPDSHDEGIRKIMGKEYTNSELIESIQNALEFGALRFDMYFMTGLPHQTKKSILDTVGFNEMIYEKIGWDSRFAPFISPMAPFLDPGSRAYENPEKFGYKLLCRTLEEHINAITGPSWKYILNYESRFITTDDLVYSTYEAALGLNRLKGRSGSIDEKVMLDNEARTLRAIEIMKKIDNIMTISDRAAAERKLAELGSQTYQYSLSTVCEKKELEFPLSNKSFKWLEIIRASLGSK